MRDHAVLALVGAGGRDHDHLALGLGQAAVLVHQRVVIGEERPKFIGAVGQRQEHVRDEAGFFLHREQAAADIVRQFVDGGGRESVWQSAGSSRYPGFTPREAVGRDHRA